MFKAGAHNLRYAGVCRVRAVMFLYAPSAAMVNPLSASCARSAGIWSGASSLHQQRHRSTVSVQPSGGKSTSSAHSRL
jgi:hypothetical protein